MKSTRSLFILARLAWILLAGITLALEILYLPANVNQLFTNWQVLQSYPVLEGLIPPQLLATTVLVLRYGVLSFFWVAALLVYFLVGRGEGSRAGFGLFTSAMLILLPFLFSGVAGDYSFLGSPWGEILTAASQILLLLGLVFFLLFYYLFANGRFAPRWLRWVALLIGAGDMVFFTYMLIDSTAEWPWAAGMLTLLAGILVGLGSQLYRYFRVYPADQKSQVRPVLVALVLIPLFIILPGVMGSSGWAGLFNILGTVLVPAALPAALLWSMLRGGLWDVDLAARQKKQMSALAGIVLLACMVGLAVVYWSEAPETAQAIDFEPLPASDLPRPVVIDTDMAPDDWMAILFLLQRQDIDVKAITVVGTGETHCAPGVINALRLVALAGESGIPAGCGRETPLAGNAVFPEEWRMRADTLNGLEAPEIEASPGGDAVEMLISIIKASPRQVTLLALGPLTNLAEAIQADPAIQENIEQIYIMGGALEVLGNVSYAGIDNQVAEWNIFIDPLALQKVLESGAPVTLVPLDATNHVPVDLDFYFQLQANHHTPEAAFVYELLNAQFSSITSGQYSFWDPLAAAILADESLGYIKEGNIMVNTQPGTSYGLTRLLNSGAPARYAKSADAERFKYEFLRTLNQP